MSEPKSKLESFLDHLRAFFTPTAESGLGRAGACPPPHDGRAQGPALPEQAGGEVSFSDRLAVLEQRLDALTAKSVVIPPAPSGVEGSGGRQAEVEGPASVQIANFVESLRTRGRFPPAFDRWGVADFMERLAAADSKSAGGADTLVCPPANEIVRPTTAQEEDVILSEAKDRDQEAPLNSLLTWFEGFLTRLPAVIEFQELAPQSGATLRSPQGVGGSRLVHFAEPHRGMSIDLASVELAERAEALAAELGISYAQALTRLREERRRTVTTA